MRRGAAVGAVLILLAILVVWWFGRPIEEAMVGEISPAAAMNAERKLERLRMDGGEARLGAEELTSLLRYRSEEWPVGILRSPAIVLEGEELRLVGYLAADDLPPIPEIERIRYLLPDSTGVVLAGRIRMDMPAGTRFELTAVEMAGMPLPASFHESVAARLDPRGGAPPGSVPLPLPEWITTARVDAGTLVLTR